MSQTKLQDKIKKIQEGLPETSNKYSFLTTLVLLISSFEATKLELYLEGHRTEYTTYVLTEHLKYLKSLVENYNEI